MKGCQLGKTVPIKQNELDPDGQRTLGSGLGPDFTPRGERIVIASGRDAKPLKIKLQPTDKNRER